MTEMNISKATRAALAQAKANHVSGNKQAAVKLNVSKKGAKAKAVKYSGTTGECVLLVSGNRGEVFRRVNIGANGDAKHNFAANTGLRTDGAVFNMTALDKLTREQKKELGTYVAERGSKAAFEVLTIAQAIARCQHGIECERNGKAIQKLISNKDKFYAASLERIGKCVVFGQSEARKLKHAHKNHVSSIERDLKAKEVSALRAAIVSGAK